MNGAEIREDLEHGGDGECWFFLVWWRSNVCTREIEAKNRRTYQDDMVAEYTNEELEALYARWLVERSET